MNNWTPATQAEVETLFEEAIASLMTSHRARFEGIKVTLRRVPVLDSPDEYVYVVAQHEGKIIYWSDVEDGWEFAEPNEAGGIDCRGCGQFELTHIAHQLFGEVER